MRATTEEFARDSYENLLFSICRFREVTGHYPSKVTVVGFSFKKARFSDLHRAAIKFPLEHFFYVGVDPENPKDPNGGGSGSGSREAAMKGEQARSVIPYSKDPYGCGEELQKKREERNPFHRSHGYYFGCPELRELLDYCGPAIFEKPLPWDGR